jgi:hypothetical protein
MDVPYKHKLETRFISLYACRASLIRFQGRSSIEHRPTSTHLQSHTLLIGSLSITASVGLSHSPHLISLDPSGHANRLECPSSTRQPASITALALDHSPPISSEVSRLVVFLSTGEFSLLSINRFDQSKSARTLTYVPSRLSNQKRIIQAVYNHPLLITLSESFNLSIFDLSQESIRWTQTLSSLTSYPPSSLVLSSPSPETYKLVLAYAIPVYPRHWSVGATELLINGYKDQSDMLLTAISPSQAQPMVVTSSRTARSVDVPQGWIDERKLRAMKEQWARKVPGIADIRTDGKWVVMASSQEAGNASPVSPQTMRVSQPSTPFGPSSSSHSPTTLQLYRLSLPSTSSITSPPPKLVFVRTMHGQTGPIANLAVADGRCVSLGLNGSIWVWDLEHGTGAEVATPSLLTDIPKGGFTASDAHVVFDERRIITTVNGETVVRTFDI